MLNMIHHENKYIQESFTRIEIILLRKMFSFAFNFPAVFSHQWEDGNTVILTYLGTNSRHPHNP